MESKQLTEWTALATRLPGDCLKCSWPGCGLGDSPIAQSQLDWGVCRLTEPLVPIYYAVGNRHTDGVLVALSLTQATRTSLTLWSYWLNDCLYVVFTPQYLCLPCAFHCNATFPVATNPVSDVGDMVLATDCEIVSESRAIHPSHECARVRHIPIKAGVTEVETRVFFLEPLNHHFFSYFRCCHCIQLIMSPVADQMMWVKTSDKTMQVRAYVLECRIPLFSLVHFS